LPPILRVLQQRKLSRDVMSAVSIPGARGRRGFS
jgi:hypothetical protein